MLVDIKLSFLVDAKSIVDAETDILELAASLRGKVLDNSLLMSATYDSTRLLYVEPATN